MAKKKQPKKNNDPNIGKVSTSLKTAKPKVITAKDLDDETLSELEPVVLDAGRRYKVAEYIAFVQWTALPSYEREPETMEAFAEKYKLNRRQLHRWKQSAEFWEDVSRVRRATMKDEFTDIIKALKKNIILNGRGQDVKVYAQLIGELKEDGDGTLALSPALEEAVKKVGKVLPD